MLSRRTFGFTYAIVLVSNTIVSDYRRVVFISNLLAIKAKRTEVRWQFVCACCETGRGLLPHRTRHHVGSCLASSVTEAQGFSAFNLNTIFSNYRSYCFEHSPQRRKTIRPQSLQTVVPF